MVVRHNGGGGTSSARRFLVALKFCALVALVAGIAALLGGPRRADLDRLGDIHAWRKLRAGFAIGLDPVSFSVTANLLWRSIDNALKSAEYRAQEAMMEQAKIPIASRGPEFEGDEADAHAFSVDIWSNASLSLQHLAEGRGYAYFHFLQPNQYVEGSKPFTSLEKRKYLGRTEISAAVSRWYPVLRERGAALSSEASDRSRRHRRR